MFVMQLGKHFHFCGEKFRGTISETRFSLPGIAPVKLPPRFEWILRGNNVVYLENKNT